MLKGKTISLRALEPGDIDILYQWENDISIWKVSNTVTPFSKHVLQQYIDTAHQDIYTSKQVRFIIETNSASGIKSVGAIDLFDFDPTHYRAGIGVLVADVSDRKKGYASEALELLVDYCFHVLSLNQLYCNIGTDNEASISLFKNKGFEISGVKKQWVRDGNKFADEYFLQLINEQHPSNSSVNSLSGK